MTTTDAPRNDSTPDLLRELRTGRRRVTDVAAECSARIAAADPDIRAFVRHDPQAVAARAAHLDESGVSGPLHGLPVAVKDLFDTADQDTGYGSPIYDGHRPAEDAELVRRLRDAGALVAGKTVTTEFALFSPGPTRNPHRLDCTPGGSSSGSAAAVAAGMVPVALGTQTAGSVIRPASYCGVVGFKPTFGSLSCKGVKPLSPSFDTPGLLGRDVETVRTVFDVLRAYRPDEAATFPETLRIAVVRTRAWQRVDAEARAAFDRVATTVAGLPWAETVDVDLDEIVAEVSGDHTTLMAFEAAHALREEYEHHAELLSAGLRSYLAEARDITAADARAAAERIEYARRAWSAQTAGVDVVLTPAVTGEAPGIASTGDPWFCRAWTALHVPVIALPLATSARGLPLGVQLVAGAGRDDLLLDAASRLMHVPAAG